MTSFSRRTRARLGRREPVPSAGWRPPVYGPQLPSDSRVQQVIDLALRIGEVQLSSGAGTSDATTTMLAVTGAFGLPSCEVDVTFTSITISCHRGMEAAPVTTMRVVRYRSMDYTRLSAVEQIVRGILDLRLTAEEAHGELDRATSAQHPYPRWVSSLAWAGMAASIAVLLGGDGWVGVIAGLVTASIDRIGRVLNHRSLPFFFQQIVGGLVATMVAVLVQASGLLSTVSPALVVGAGLTVLLSGFAVVGTVQDAISGFFVTAAGRAMEIAVMSAGLLAGVIASLQIAIRFGVPLQISDTVTPALGQLPLQLAAGAATAACFALASYAQPRALLVATLAGATGAVSYYTLRILEFDQVMATAVAATAIGLAGGVVSRRLKVSPLVVAVSGISPLIPGLTVYRGLFALAVNTNLQGLSTLLLALTIGSALAAGVVLGQFLAQPVRTGLGRLERQLAGPRLSGPSQATERRLE